MIDVGYWLLISGLNFPVPSLNRNQMQITKNTKETQRTQRKRPRKGSHRTMIQTDCLLPIVPRFVNCQLIAYCPLPTAY